VSRFFTANRHNGHTVPFTLLKAGKYKREDKLKTQTAKTLNRTHKKQTTQNTAKQNYPGLVASYNTRPGNEVNMLSSSPEATPGSHSH